MSTTNRDALPPPRPRTMDPLLSVIVAVYNEEETLVAFLDTIEPELHRAGVRHEIVFVNDGSRDATLSVILAEAEHRPGVRVLNLSRNFGKEAAMTAGLDEADGDIVLLIDVDLQDPPSLIPGFVQRWREGADIVYGLRESRDSDGRVKATTAALFYRLFNWMSDTPIPHNVGDFRLIDRRVVLALRALPERGRFMKGLFAWVGFPSIAVPYVRPARVLGTTKWNYWRLWNFALDGIVSFSTAPLRVWTYFGIAIAGLAFLYASFIVVRVAAFGIDVPGYASLIIVLLFSTAMNLISLGMIGEYVSRLFLETKRRPIYLLEGIYPAPAQTRTEHPVDQLQSADQNSWT